MSRKGYIRAYLQYRRKAKGRHGTHSPFVYAFVEGALKPPSRKYREAGWPYKAQDGASVSWKPSLLVQRIVHFLDVREILYMDAASGAVVRLVKDKETTAQQSVPALNALGLKRLLIYPPQLISSDIIAGMKADEVLLYDGPTWEQEAADWERMSRHKNVRLSMDLFRIGLLFFAEAFKVPQHFVLKYPL